MSPSNAQWLDDARGTLETLVQSVDALPDDLDAAAIPEDVRSLLNYINIQCRALVQQANA
jgi:hypothetical protein